MSSSTNPIAVLNDAQWSLLNQAIAPLNRDQLTWVSGYLAGLAQSQVATAVAGAQVAAQPAAASSLTILYGSQTGNAKGVAEEFKAKVEAAGIQVSLTNMADYKAKQLKSETHLVVIASTNGEGEPPDDAAELHEFLGGKKAPKLEGVKFAVLGLGDSSYEFFCQTGKDFDERLAKLGAERVAERVDCDVDYDGDANAWGDALLAKLEDELKAAGNAQVANMPAVSPVAAAVSQYSKKNPYTATLLESQKITGRDSVKDIRHVEISLEGSGIQYKAGDALGVWFLNDKQLVADLLALLELDGQASVALGEESMTLEQALVEKLELTQSYPTFVTAYAKATDNNALLAKTDDKAALREYLAERQIIDIVREFPGKLTAEQLVEALRPITPRLYSIASSQAEVEDEVHLTVGLVEYDAHGSLHQGGASGFLSKRLEEGDEVRVFIEHNDNFRLPENGDTPVIMIGPGTGIAPFRAFMQQRDAEGAEGKNWLFFGNPNFTQDFLYQVEWQRYVKEGLVNKISLAFSRDQKEKIYVQHRILEQGEEFYRWLEEGAHVYVCGDANRMAKDVNDAMIQVVEKHGNKSREEAEQYVNELRRAKRYQKDVY